MQKQPLRVIVVQRLQVTRQLLFAVVLLHYMFFAVMDFTRAAANE